MNKISNIFIFTIFILNIVNGQSQIGCLIDTSNKMEVKEITYNTVSLPINDNSHYTPPPTPTNLDHRMVYWVHGMNGSDVSWTAASTASSSILNITDFKPRKIINILPDYSNQQISLAAGADALYGYLTVDPTLGPDYQYKNSFVIAHSQGGLVTREMIRQNTLQNKTKKIGGFVTFGTIHRGGQGLTAQNRILADQFFTRAALDLSDGVLQTVQEFKDGLLDNFWVKLLHFENKIKYSIPEKVDMQSFIKNKLFYNEETINDGVLLSLINGIVTSPMADEIAVGSPSIATLNAFNPGSEIASMAFYGDKKAFTKNFTDGTAQLLVQPFYSLIHYAVNNPNDDGYFNAYNDYKFALRARNAQLDYINQIDKRNSLITILNQSFCIYELNDAFIGYTDPNTVFALQQHPVSRIWSPSKIRRICKSKNRDKEIESQTRIIVAYRKGADWFDRAENLWETAMGAQTKSVELTGYCARKIIPINGNGSQVIQRYIPEVAGACGLDDAPAIPSGWKANGGWYKETATVISVKPFDGAALAESAKDLPFRNSIMTDAQQRMWTSSHFQMRNDENTKQKLNLVFDGDCHEYFKTAKLP